jgi:pyrroloquinoline quinone biosynthesis protein E
MGGWASTGLNVTPEGLVLPCHAAQTIKSLSFDSVREKPLAEIWYEGAAFNAFRGTDWMNDLCGTCDRKLVDFGGCRCQAMAIAGDPAATDPVCMKSPHHAIIQGMAESFSHEDAPLIYREMPKVLAPVS